MLQQPCDQALCKSAVHNLKMSVLNSFLLFRFQSNVLKCCFHTQYNTETHRYLSQGGRFYLFSYMDLALFTCMLWCSEVFLSCTKPWRTISPLLFCFFFVFFCSGHQFMFSLWSQNHCIQLKYLSNTVHVVFLDPKRFLFDSSEIVEIHLILLYFFTAKMVCPRNLTGGVLEPLTKGILTRSCSPAAWKEIHQQDLWCWLFSLTFILIFLKHRF